MSNSERRKVDWWFPPDLAALLWFYIALPLVLIGSWLGTGFHNARAVGDSSMFWTAVTLGGIGTLLLFLARLPLYRQRRFLVFGPRELDGRHRRLYWWAYGFIAASLVLLVMLVMIVR